MRGFANRTFLHEKDLPNEFLPLFIRFASFEIRFTTDPIDISEQNGYKFPLCLHRIPPHAFFGTTFKINALHGGNSCIYNDRYLLKYVGDLLLPNYCHSYSFQFIIFPELSVCLSLFLQCFYLTKFATPAILDSHFIPY